MYTTLRFWGSSLSLSQDFFLWQSECVVSQMAWRARDHRVLIFVCACEFSVGRVFAFWACVWKICMRSRIYLLGGGRSARVRPHALPLFCGALKCHGRWFEALCSEWMKRSARTIRGGRSGGTCLSKTQRLSFRNRACLGNKPQRNAALVGETSPGNVLHVVPSVCSPHACMFRLKKKPCVCLAGREPAITTLLRPKS